MISVFYEVHLLDDSYPIETRTLALEFLKTILVFNDEKESSPVFFDKSFFKKTMLSTEVILFCLTVCSFLFLEVNFFVLFVCVFFI